MLGVKIAREMFKKCIAEFGRMDKFATMGDMVACAHRHGLVAKIKLVPNKRKVKK